MWVASAVSLGEFGTPTRFDLGLPAGRVDLLPLNGGAILISWVELDPDQPGIAALLTRRVGPTGELGECFPVAEFGAGRDWGFPVAALRGDEVMWVYTDPTGSDGELRLRAKVAPLPP